MKTFKYRIYPNKEQIELLDKQLRLCKWLYNACLEQRLKAYKKGLKWNVYEQKKQLTELKNANEEYKEVYSQVLQEVLYRLDEAYQGFYRRVKRGETPGFPRFKSEIRSLVYPQYDKMRLENGKRIEIPKLGWIKIKYHREIEGTPKTLTVKKSKSGKWYVTIVCKDTPIKDKIKDLIKMIGIDLGLEDFLVGSDGVRVKNPRLIKQFEERIKHIQVVLSRTVKGSKNRIKIKKLLGVLYEKLVNKRLDFLHKLSRKIVDSYDLICFEDLDIVGMLTSINIKLSIRKGLRRSINDVDWGILVKMIIYKAEQAGKWTVEVYPKNTSKECSICGRIKYDLKLWDRVYVCDECKAVLDRDYNASCNVLSRGLRLIRMEHPELKLVESSGKQSSEKQEASRL